MLRHGIYPTFETTLRPIGIGFRRKEISVPCTLFMIVALSHAHRLCIMLVGCQLAEAFHLGLFSNASWETEGTGLAIDVTDDCLVLRRLVVPLEHDPAAITMAILILCGTRLPRRSSSNFDLS